MQAFIDQAVKYLGLKLVQGETGTKRKSKLWTLEQPYGNYGQRKEIGNYRSLSAVINALCWELQFTWGNDWENYPKAKLSIQSKALHDEGLDLIAEWDAIDKREKNAQHGQAVIVFLGEWAKFTRNVRNIKGDKGTCIVLGEIRKVQFNEDRQVWFEINEV